MVWGRSVDRIERLKWKEMVRWTQAFGLDMKRMSKFQRDERGL
jgi:hypothetical protein